MYIKIVITTMSYITHFIFIQIELSICRNITDLIGLVSISRTEHIVTP